MQEISKESSQDIILNDTFEVATQPIITLNDSTQNIIEIFHLADIHIKNSYEMFDKKY